MGVLQGDVAGVGGEAWCSLLFQQQEGVGALLQHPGRHIQRHLWPHLWPVAPQVEVVDPCNALGGGGGIVTLRSIAETNLSLT